MRVLHWYPNFLHGGGCANAVLGLATAQARQGAHVIIAAAAPSDRPLYQSLEAPPGVELLVWQPSRTLEIGGQHVRLAHRREIAKLSALDPDVVHAHGEFNVDNLRVPRLFRCAVVISPHGACHPVVLAKSRRIAKRLFLAIESILLASRIRVFHALSPAEAEHLAAVFSNVVSYCVPQGPSVLVDSRLLPASPPTGKSSGVSFLFLGRLDVFTKGLDILLEAFAAVSRRAGGGSERLILAGPDWRGGRGWLERRAAELGVEKRVEFTGPLVGAQVGTVLNAADVYVQLSRHEGFPLSVAEALLAGKPAVLSRAVGTVSYAEIASLEHVQVVPPRVEAAAAAMVEAAEHLPAMTAAASSSWKMLADFFSWDRIARLHLSQYLPLAQQRPHLSAAS
jgi:glycosyltransferase involved in cell wall biosynthesis